MKARLFVAVMVCCGLAVVATAMLAQAQEPLPGGQTTNVALGTGFTYQGRLLLSGTPLSGTCDLQFTLWDAGTGGTQVGITQTASALSVSDGEFTVVLDFGAEPFAGDARWLEVSVRSPAGSGPYITLSPRQALTAVPYALHARSAWQLTGNAGTSPGSNFLGTTDDQALELKVNNSRALRLEPNARSPNIVAGYGGNGVAAGAYAATISGGGESGRLNRVLDSYGTVSGGYSNTASFLATIGGGYNNTAGPWRGTIAGGCGNTASGQDSIVGGGTLNAASGQFAFIGGGTQNTASDLLATVSGGGYNIAGDGGAVSGGSTNVASGWFSAIGGGFMNTASGCWATVGGGCENTASGDYSFAAGQRAKATQDGSFVWADSTDADFCSGAPDQVAVRATGGVSMVVGSVLLQVENRVGGNAGGLSIDNIGVSSAELAGAQGVRGHAEGGSGVYGSSYMGDGVEGTSAKGTGGSFDGLGLGVYGEARSDYPLYPGPWYGVWGKTFQGTWSDLLTMGVKGEGGIGVAGTGDAGVYGEGLSYGGYFTTSAGVGLFGGVSGSHFTGIGVQGESTSPAGTGVYGHATNLDYGGTGVKGVGDSYGVYGQSTGGFGGYFKSTSGAGLRAESTSGDLIDARIPGNRRFYVSNAGNVYADGTYSSPAADLAEMLPASAGLKPGDVLIMGQDGKLARCSAPYQSTVVGVYSTQPGFVGGAGDDADLDGQVPLAVIGVVPVKVTAENGPIVPGDALTTSSMPGHAMKAKAIAMEGMSFFPGGVIIGKALERLDQGTGTIQMLVMLQ
jgi:hypothetical protein